MTNSPVLRRDVRDARLAGVCAALARSWNVDTHLVRLGFVVLTIVTGGFAAAGYLALWLLLPEQGSHTEPARQWFPFTRDWSGSSLVAAVVGASVLAAIAASGLAPGGIVVALLLWLIVRYGFGSRRPGPSIPTAPREPRTEFERLAAAWQGRVEDVRLGRGAQPLVLEPWVPQAVAPASGSRRDPARRQASGRTWSLIAIVLGITWTGFAAAASTGVRIPELAWAASTLAVLGLALVAVARPARAAVGRPFGLLTLTVLAALVTGVLMIGQPGRLAAFTTPDPVLIGEPADLATRRVLEVGTHTIDLSELAVGTSTATAFQLDAGEVTLVLPERGNVRVVASVDVGEIVAPDGEDSGFDVARTFERLDAPGKPVRTVEVDVDLGRVEIRS